MLTYWSFIDVSGFFYFFQLLLYQARASTERGAVDPQAGTASEDAQHTRILSGAGPGEQRANTYRPK